MKAWPFVAEWTLVPLKLAASRAVTPSVPAEATKAVPLAMTSRVGARTWPPLLNEADAASGCVPVAVVRSNRVTELLAEALLVA